MSDVSPQTARGFRIWCEVLTKVAFVVAVWNGCIGDVPSCVESAVSIPPIVFCLNVWLREESDLR